MFALQLDAQPSKIQISSKVENVVNVKAGSVNDTYQYLHRGHVVEGVVQFLTDGFVLEFLCIELICMSTQNKTNLREADISIVEYVIIQIFSDQRNINTWTFLTIQ